MVEWSKQGQNTDSDKYRQTRFWFPVGPRLDVSKALITESRIKLGILVQFLTGHGWLNKHRWLVDLECTFRPSQIDPMCRLCGKDEETLLHLWSSCEELQDVRSNAQRLGLWQWRELDWFLGTTKMVLLLKQSHGEQEL